MIILLNRTLAHLSFLREESTTLENEIAECATQICQSYEYYANFAFVGNTYMKFALQAACAAMVEECVRAWTVDRLDEMAASVRVSPSSIFCVHDMDSFEYLG